MKRIIYVFVLLISVLACKKKKDTPLPTNDEVKCSEYSEIDFSYKGTPIGSFANCIRDVDSNVYRTVIIGKQQWMAENLRTSRYNDGSYIPNCESNDNWMKTKGGVRCFYKNDSINYAKYGTLYNWYTTDSTSNGNKNICPTGWHVPLIQEWRVLFNQLGGDSIAGGKMKQVGSKVWDNEDEKVTNSSLFTALPSGSRSLPSWNFEDENGFGHFGSEGSWWSKSVSKETPIFPYRVWMLDGNIWISEIYMYENKSKGMSIRCVKD